MIDLIPFCLSILISSRMALYLTEKPLVPYEDINVCTVSAQRLKSELEKKTAVLLVRSCGCVSVPEALEDGIIDTSQLHLLRSI